MKIAPKHFTIKEKALFEQLITLLADLRHPQEVRYFLSDFLTEAEQLVLSKRLAILWELRAEKSYEEIKQELGVSSATISSASQFKEKPGIQSALAKIALDKKIADLLTKVGIFT